MLPNVGLPLKLIIVLMPPLALFGMLGLAAVVLAHEVADVNADVVYAGHAGSPQITPSTGRPAFTPTAAEASS